MIHRRTIGIAMIAGIPVELVGIYEQSVCFRGYPLIAESPPAYMNDEAIDQMIRRARDACASPSAPALKGKLVVAKFSATDHGEYALISVDTASPSKAALLEQAKRYGWAIMARLYAFTPETSGGLFEPAVISPTLWAPPNRLDHFERREIKSLNDGCEQILTWGEDRGQALAALRYSLDSALETEGRTTLDLTRAVLAHDRFERGEIDEGFVAEEFPSFRNPSSPSAPLEMNLLDVDLGIGHARHFAGLCALFQARIIERDTAQSRWAVQVDEHHFSVTLDPPCLQPDGQPALIAIDEDSDKATVEIEVKTDWQVGDSVAYCWIDDRLMIVRLERGTSGFTLSYRGAYLCVHISPLAL